MRTALAVLILLALSVPATADQRAARDAEWDNWWSTSGTFENPSTLGYSPAWGAWVITALQCWDFSQWGGDLILEGFAFPCAGEQSQWALWVEEEYSPDFPSDPFSPDYSGSFTPVVADASAPPPYAYTYVSLPEPMLLYGFDWLFVAYENPGRVGYSEFGETNTWSWWDGHWEDDSWLEIAADIQVLGTIVVISTAETSWSAIKSLY